MQIRRRRSSKKVFLPGSSVYFGEVQEFNRRGRDAYNAALLGGHSPDRVDAVLEHGIRDFLLPSDEGDVRFAGQIEQDMAAYDDLDEELEDWLVMRILEINGAVIRAEEAEYGYGEEALGNYPSSPGELSEDTPSSDSPSDVPTNGT